MSGEQFRSGRRIDFTHGTKGPCGYHSFVNGMAWVEYKAGIREAFSILMLKVFLSKWLFHMTSVINTAELRKRGDQD